MSRSNRQVARLIEELVRGVQSGKIKLRWIVLIVVLAAGYLLLQPVLKEKLGVALPGVGDVVQSSQPSQLPNQNDSTRTSKSTPDSTAATSKELEAILNSDSRRVYTSPAGLRYTGGSLQGNRLKHLMTHARDQPDRAGQHGVFDSDDVAEIVSLVDEAYLQAQTGRDTQTRREEERIVYDVNLRRRIGYIGGQTGNRKNRPAARHMRLVVEGNRLITAFPLLP